MQDDWDYLFLHTKSGEKKTDNQERPGFNCILQCGNCPYVKNGKVCGKRTCIGIEFCRKHLWKTHQLEIKQSSLEFGDDKNNLGLFAKAYPKNDARVPVFNATDKRLVMVYTGEIIDKHEEKRRYGEATGTYVADLGDKKRVVDGACKRGAAAMINHSKQNNARLMNTGDGGERRVEIVAVGDIYDGDEILVNYGEKYFGEKNDVLGRGETIRIKRRHSQK